MTILEILGHKDRSVITIAPDRSVLDAVMTLVEHNIGGLVVVSGEQPVGILTERDVLRLTARTPGALHTIPVESAMTRSLVTATPTDDLRQAMALMTSRKIRHLPVLDAGQLVGIVSIGDLVNACRLLAEDENLHLKGYIQGAPAEAIKD
jgi:CBS domain-containing protein